MSKLSKKTKVLAITMAMISAVSTGSMAVSAQGLVGSTASNVIVSQTAQPSLEIRNESSVSKIFIKKGEKVEVRVDYSVLNDDGTAKPQIENRVAYKRISDSNFTYVNSDKKEYNNVNYKEVVPARAGTYVIRVYIKDTSDPNASEVTKDFKITVDDPKNPKSAIEYIEGLEHQSKPTVVNVSSDKKSYSEVLSTEGGGLQFNFFEAVSNKDSSEEQQLINNGNSDVIFPGALISLDDNLKSGNPSRLLVERKPMTIDVKTAVGGDSISDVPMSVGTATQAIKDIVDAKIKKSEGKEIPVLNTLFSKTYVRQKEDLVASLGLNIKKAGSIGISFGAKNHTEVETFVMKYRQIFYNASISSQLTSKNCFADSVTALDLANARIGRTNSDKSTVVPGIISNVTYGRDVYVVIQAKNGDTHLGANANIKLDSLDMTAKASVSWDRVMEEATVTVVMDGAEADAVKDIIKVKSGKELVEKMNAYTTITDKSAIYPLSYTVRDIVTGTAVQFQSTNVSYQNVKSVTSQPVTVKTTTNDVTPHVWIFGQKIKEMKADGSFKYVAAPKEKSNKLSGTYYSYAKHITKGNVITIPADVDISTVKFVVGYEGTAGDHFVQRIFSMNDLSRWYHLGTNKEEGCTKYDQVVYSRRNIITKLDRQAIYYRDQITDPRTVQNVVFEFDETACGPLWIGGYDVALRMSVCAFDTAAGKIRTFTVGSTIDKGKGSKANGNPNKLIDDLRD